ncbi:isocitrate lyase/phosphoenolpyruvate mutase family protein [Pseudoalteromonas sp. C2R02]|uniref:isocitrate lyase/PEP mutase family protein n=1 Tax=Pseudoalteromonas sp. C2R02 TaxID=2841565 RepID=UPI001C0A4A5C|nr:isocitrate lyase/phosphoenolpyruvate mutase family protein [Pseudoalteromonas sp. C2R02]MBU2968430.1 isocitrate lyase/phosphoenolpyruvate mutase family protein [Pseudoalteromonas sp. C2R02]
MKFKQLHHQNTPLLICNVWDANSAKTAQKLNFKAIGTSSAAIAQMLGYEDGEQMRFDELLFIVKRILASTTLPLTVDIESGYSRDPLVTAGFIKTLSELGVVGINIEDSLVNKSRELINADAFADYLNAVTEQLAKDNVDIFINVRTDTFILGTDNVLEQTIERIKRYETANIDGVFVPCITNISDITAVIESTDLAINVMCMPELPNFEVLEQLNVNRISMGNFLFDSLAADLESKIIDVLEAKSFAPVFDN